MDGDSPAFVDGRPDFLVACAPASSWTVLDTWHTTGLAGSGSNDYTVSDLFVPERHVFRFSDPVQRPEPLYGWPGMFFINMAGVALGLARRAIDEAIAITSDKLLVPELVLLRDTSPRGSRSPAPKPSSAPHARTCTTPSTGSGTCSWPATTLSIELRVAVGLSRAHAFRVAREIAQSMSDLIGASSIYSHHPLERLVRDAITMSQHIAAQERMYEMLGELRLTGTAPMPLL